MAVSQAVCNFDSTHQYGLRSVSSNKWLDGRGGESNPIMNYAMFDKNNEPFKFLAWKIFQHDDRWVFEGVGSKGKYLDGRGGEKDPLMTLRNPPNSFLQWIIEGTPSGNFALRGVASSKYLDGRGGEQNPLMTQRNPVEDNFLQWKIMDLNTRQYLEPFRSATNIVFCGAKWKNVMTIPEGFEEKTKIEVGWTSTSSSQTTHSTTETHAWSVEANQSWNIYGQGGSIKASYSGSMETFTQSIQSQSKTVSGSKSVETTWVVRDYNRTIWQLVFLGRIKGTSETIEYLCEDHMITTKFNEGHPPLDLAFFRSIEI